MDVMTAIAVVDDV